MDNKKRFPISGSVWSIDICMQQEWSACCCVSLRPSVSNWKWPSFSRLRKYNAHPFSSASFASLSSAHYYGHCCGAKDHIFFCLFPVSFSCFHLLDELSPLPPLPFCSSVMCVWGSRNTGFKPQNFQNSGSVGGASGPCWGQQIAGTAAVSCSALGVGMAEWWAYCMLLWLEWLINVNHLCSCPHI